MPRKMTTSCSFASSKPYDEVKRSQAAGLHQDTSQELNNAIPHHDMHPYNLYIEPA